MDREKNADTKKEKELEPDRETLHTTDPQENMEGPISSSTRGTGEAFDSNESRENADEKKDSRM
jgi:hypothetical protein